MKKDKLKYLNFPISLLQGFMEDPQRALANIIDYCIIYEMKAKQRPFDEVRLDYNMATPSDMEGWLEIATELFNKTSRNQPHTGLEVGMFWEYYLEEGAFGKVKKTDEEKATLLAFLAIKSILGCKLWYKLGKQEIIFHRMAGFPDCKSEIPDTIKPFCTRYKFDRIKKDLQAHWGISIYSNHTRGMFISNTLTIAQLALEAEKRKLAMKQREAGLKAQQEAAYKYAMMKLGKPTSSTYNNYR